MRVFALSDVHADYAVNRQWLLGLSSMDFQQDVLILAGDVSDNLKLLDRCLRALSSKFDQVLFVPGNHELWVIRDEVSTSLEKFHKISEVADHCGASMKVERFGSLTIVPLFSWYDFSFGEPGKKLLRSWSDFRACRWPDQFTLADVNASFLARNEDNLGVRNERVVSFSHFLPRIDLMPESIPLRQRYLYPVLGSSGLGEQIKILAPQIHVYGHSHVKRQVTFDGVQYVNNAFGYPSETRISSKELRCVLEL